MGPEELKEMMTKFDAGELKLKEVVAAINAAYMHTHIQEPVTVKFWGQTTKTFTVDQGIKSLLQKLWSAGYITSNSCQGESHSGHKTFISFQKTEMAVLFAETARDITTIYIELHPDYAHAFVRFDCEHLEAIAELEFTPFQRKTRTK